MTEQEQLQRIASLPTDTPLSFDMRHLSRDKWVWHVSWVEDGRKRILYLGRDTYGHIARLTAQHPPTRPYRMEAGRRRLKRRGAFAR